MTFLSQILLCLITHYDLKNVPNNLRICVKHTQQSFKQITIYSILFVKLVEFLNILTSFFFEARFYQRNQFIFYNQIEKKFGIIDVQRTQITTRMNKRLERNPLTQFRVMQTLSFVCQCVPAIVTKQTPQLNLKIIAHKFSAETLHRVRKMVVISNI